jgi:hypothetical protein
MKIKKLIMKKVILIQICLLLVCIAGFGFKKANDKTFVTITNSEHYYELSSVYDKAKTRSIQQYINDCITDHRDMSFVNAQLDADITLDSKMTFHIKSYPGELELKFDKRKNNTNDYTKFKKMCEGIKTIVGEH